MTKVMLDEQTGPVASNARECIVRVNVHGWGWDAGWIGLVGRQAVFVPREAMWPPCLRAHPVCVCVCVLLVTCLGVGTAAQALGLGNILCGVFGSMGGCALIGTTVINQKSGGVGRLSSFSAGATVLVIILAGHVPHRKGEVRRRGGTGVFLAGPTHGTSACSIVKSMFMSFVRWVSHVAPADTKPSTSCPAPPSLASWYVPDAYYPFPTRSSVHR
jgi:hypothetical protein